MHMQPVHLSDGRGNGDAGGPAGFLRSRWNYVPTTCAINMNNEHNVRGTQSKNETALGIAVWQWKGRFSRASRPPWPSSPHSTPNPWRASNLIVGDTRRQIFASAAAFCLNLVYATCMAYIKKCRPDSSVKQMSSSALIYTRVELHHHVVLEMGVLQVSLRLTDCSAGWLHLCRPRISVGLGDII